MSKLTPHANTVSLDDLARAHRDAFDQVARASLHPRSAPEPAGDAAQNIPVAVEMPSGGAPSSDGADDIAEALTRRFGGWSARLLEESRQADRLHVRCLLQVDGESRIGEATVTVSETAGDALRSASALALRAAMRALAPVSDESVAVAAAPSSVEAGAVPAERVNVALHHLRKEAAAVLSDAAGAALREADEEAVSITDAVGRLISGSLGTGLPDLLRERRLDLAPDDMALIADPMACGGALAGPGRVMLIRAVSDRGGVIGHVAVQGPLDGLGGAGTGGASIATTSAVAEGVRLPPVKLIEAGRENAAIRTMLCANAREPVLVDEDLNTLMSACDAAADGLQRLAARLGGDSVRHAGAVLIDRAARALGARIAAMLPVEPQSFEDVIDEDGQGGGPHRLKLSVWREGERGYFDFTGSAPVAAAAVNHRLGGEWFRQQVGTLLLGPAVMRFAAAGGFDDLIRLRLPDPGLLRPPPSAALGDGRQTMARLCDVLSGALALGSGQPTAAAPYGADVRLLFVSTEGARFEDPLFGGLGGGQDGDGPDGHSQWPGAHNQPAESVERRHRLLVEACRLRPDSGGAGRYRGGNGIEKTYRFETEGHVALRGNRRLSHPYGVAGGAPGERASLTLLRAGGGREDLPATLDPLPVSPGDRLVVSTAGGGGWGDPLARTPEAVRRDVAAGQVALDRAREVYGVVISDNLDDVDLRATENLRDSMRRSRRPLSLFAFGDSAGGLSAARAGVGRE